MTQTITPYEGLVLRAGVYEILAVGYTYPQGEYRQRILNLATDLAPWVGLIKPEWTAKMHSLQESLAQANPSEHEAEYNLLFSGAMAAAPYETAYELDIFRKQNSLADMAGFYKAFGFAVPAGSRWQPDHIGVQLEFCSILLQRAAMALQENWDDQAATCVEALRNFLQDHLGRWSQAFSEDLGKVAVLPFYEHLAELTAQWVEVELRSLDLDPDRLRSRHISAEDVEAPSCGGCTGCGPDGPIKGAPCPTPPS